MTDSPSLPLRPLDLKRHLIVRVILFALAVLLLGTAVALLETRERVRTDIQRTGVTLRQLITDEIHKNSTAYSRSLDEINLDLETLQPVGELIHFCVYLHDLYDRPVSERCFAREIALPAPLAAMMRQVIGADAQFTGSIGQYPGITVGRMTVTPNYGSELIGLCKNLVNLLAVSLTIMLMSFLIYRPVRNALAPSEIMLETIKRLENGELQARMPTFALIELDRIGQGFNHLAERLQLTIGMQQRLAHRLLTAREEERLYLSRELHDEFGQYLASLNAEASFARELAAEGMPALTPCAESIGHTVAHMMETLQQILRRLRPVGLDEFGLAASLRQLVEQWNRRGKAPRFQLTIDAAVDRFPDNVTVTLYRIVQESITNAVKHGQDGAVDIALAVENTALRLRVVDNGSPATPTAVRGEQGKAGGLGLLCMEERVLALGGTLDIRRQAGGGIVIEVVLPLRQPDGGLS